MTKDKSITKIVKTTAKYFRMPDAVLLDKKMRSKRVTYARHIAQYLSRELTYLSLTQVADDFKCNHTAIIYACKRTAELMRNADGIAKVDVEAITAKVRT